MFDSVGTRDRVASYASNLADWDTTASGPVSFRLQIPDHLRSIFRTLETYGHYLKNNNKKGMRRNIKFDDTRKTLFMDICMGGESTWMSVSYELAADEMETLRPNCSARARLSSRGSQDGIPAARNQSPSPRVQPSSATSSSHYSSAASTQSWSTPTPGPSKEAENEMNVDDVRDIISHSMRRKRMDSKSSDMDKNRLRWIFLSQL